MALALFLTDATNQAAFATQARVLPSSKQALQRVREALVQEPPNTAAEAQIQQARQLSATTLERAQVLVPALPGIKRLQKIIYTQLQRAMLGQVTSDQAIETAAADWNRYSRSRWP